MNVLRVIKINILAIIAFPLLALATVVKLVAKAMEKTLTIIGALIIYGFITLAFEIAKDPSGFGQAIVMLIAVLILGGIIFAIVFFVLSLISAAVMSAVALIISLVNGIYELIYAGYAGLYHICYEDYCLLEMSPNAKRGSCFFYTLLRIVNRIIVFFATHALKILIVLCVAVIGYSIYQYVTYIDATFGMGIFEFIKLFPVFDVIRSVVLTLAFYGGFVVVLISLGIEWSEWGEEMSLSTSDYEAYIKNINSGSVDMSKASVQTNDDKVTNRRLEKCTHYFEIVNYHLSNSENFVQNILPVAEKSEDHILRANSGQYITDLHEIVEKIDKYNGEVPIEVLEAMMPQIDRLDVLLRKIERQVQQIKENQEQKPVMSFFSGCDTKEKLEKRYKALCKTYHPDSDAGDEETFKRMRDEYEKRKSELN